MINRSYKKQGVFVAAISILFILHIFTYIKLLPSPLRLDETNTYLISNLPFLDLIRSAVLFQGYSPLHFLITKIALYLEYFFSMEVALRLPSLVCLYCTAFLIYRIVKKQVSFEIAVLSVLFFITSESILHLAFQARTYMMTLMFVTYSIFLILNCRNQETFWLQLSITNALIIYGHYFFVQIFPVQLLLLIFQDRNCFSRFLKSQVFTLALCLPCYSQVKNYAFQRAKLGIYQIF